MRVTWLGNILNTLGSLASGPNNILKISRTKVEMLPWEEGVLGNSSKTTDNISYLVLTDSEIDWLFKTF